MINTLIGINTLNTCLHIKIHFYSCAICILTLSLLCIYFLYFYKFDAFYDMYQV